ncbi:hypothetical protein, partial [Acidaminococcus timonensis]|uniref:hypothetical protein n=1 Tax=Acidaminococcus timonensis TaxID=1871002 RepID=UPI0026F235F9
MRYVDDVKTIRFIYVNMQEVRTFLSVVSGQWSVGVGVSRYHKLVGFTFAPVLPRRIGVPLADHGAEREAIFCFAHPPGASFKRSALA